MLLVALGRALARPGLRPTLGVPHLEDRRIGMRVVDDDRPWQGLTGSGLQIELEPVRRRLVELGEHLRGESGEELGTGGDRLGAVRQGDDESAVDPAAHEVLEHRCTVAGGVLLTAEQLGQPWHLDLDLGAQDVGDVGVAVGPQTADRDEHVERGRRIVDERLEPVAGAEDRFDHGELVALEGGHERPHEACVHRGGHRYDERGVRLHRPVVDPRSGDLGHRSEAPPDCGASSAAT